jgi:hypothetical protein
MHPSLQGRCKHLAVLGFFVVLTLAITYPMPLHMDRFLVGEDIDDYINPWVDWWTNHVLTTPGESLYHTDYLFYPDGVSLVFHSFSHVNTSISLALQPVIGQPAAYNTSVLLAYLLSAFGMYLLVAYLTGSRVAGIFSGVVFAFNPYHVFESHHPVLVSAQWMPFSVLYLVRWLRERRGNHLALAAFFFLLNALTSWHLMTFFSLWLAVFVTYYTIFERDCSWRKRVWGFVTFGLLAGLLVLPFLLPLLREQFTAQSYMEADVEQGVSMDLWDVMVPPWIESVTVSGYLGIVTLLLVGIGVWKGGREARMWATSALIFFLIAIGPQLQFRKQALEGLTLPWSTVFIPLLRHPFRFQLLVMFGLAGAAGYGWAVVRSGLKGRWLYVLFAAIALGLLIADYSHWPFPHVDPVVSPFYLQLAREPGDFAIAPIPSTRQTAKYYMYYQTLHGKKIVGGHVSRTPPEALAFMQGHDLIWSVCTLGSIDSEITDISRQFDQLAEVDIRYLVLHKDRVSPNLAEQWRDFLPLIPAYEDEFLLAYRTDLELGRDYAFVHELTPTLGIVRAYADAEVHQGTFFGLEIVWGAAEPPGRDLQVQVEFVDQTGGVGQIETMSLYPGWSSSQWVSDTVLIGRYRMRADPDLSPGEYTVQVRVVDELTGEPFGAPAEVTTLTVQPVTRTYELPTPDVRVDGCFGGRLCLLGYDVKRQGDSLEMVFHWQATRLMERDYVISTRLLDTSGESRVCQMDAAPRDWSYPTTWWDVGEVVSDTRICDLSDVTVGQYRLEVVVYEPHSGDVLSPSGTGPIAQSVGGGLLLGEIDVPLP